MLGRCIFNSYELGKYTESWNQAYEDCDDFNKDTLENRQLGTAGRTSLASIRNLAEQQAFGKNILL